MRIAYLDCFAGISGDMFLAALLDSGLDLKILLDATAALNLNASLRIEKVDRSGISATRVIVLEDGRPAEAAHAHEHSHLQHQHTHEHHQHPKTQHLHKVGHSHDHDHHHQDHHHGRSLSTIRSLIQSTPLADPVKQTAIQAFELLGASEAKIHNVDIEKIHFHEVGAVDAIVDIVCAAAGIHAIENQAKIETGNPVKWHCSPINIGGGMVDCAHGRFPVPAPATADLLRGLPTYSAHAQQELTTPTGAAILRTLNPTFGPQPAMRVQSIGYGAGSRNSKDLPNVLRLSIGEAIEIVTTKELPFSKEVSSRPVDNHPNEVSSRPEAALLAAGVEEPALSLSKGPASPSQDANVTTVAILETALDDISPQILAHVTERALALGALDVMSTAVQMKKGRLGTLITILADDAQVPALEDLLLRETSTLGVRIHHERRSCLDRTHTTVTTPYGDIRIKVGSRNNQTYNAAPEFEDCRAAAAQHNVPVKQVQQAAIAAFHNASNKQ
jgi:pyridinium-3,5-bisthiocarboxylic acid mononucleotide nickel chelatase